LKLQTLLGEMLNYTAARHKFKVLCDFNYDPWRRDFHHRLLGMADPVSAEPGRWRLEFRQKAGQLFGQIPCRERDPALLPPYRIFIDGGTWTEVTEADFEEWAKIVVPKKTDGIN
jgi:hypothetical protein